MSEMIDNENASTAEPDCDDPSNPSTFGPLVKWSEAWWATRPPDVQARRCKARLSDGSGLRCGKPAMKAQKVCGSHGGKAKRSMDAARRRIAESADPAAKQLLKLAFDDKQTADIRLKATLQLLDRAGVNAKTSVDVEVSAKPIDQILDGIADQLEVTSRAAWRRTQGIEDDSDRTPPALAGSHSTDPIDAEVLTDAEFTERMAARAHVNNDGHPVTLRDSRRQPDDDTASGMPSTDQPMTVMEGAERTAELRRREAMRRQHEVREAGHAVIHPARRALPPGQSR